MPKIYMCKPCEYETERLYSYERHCVSEKHKKTLDKFNSKLVDDTKCQIFADGSFICQYCDKKLLDKSHRTRHFNTCKERSKQVIHNEIIKLRAENKQLKKDIATKNGIIIDKDKEISVLKDTLSFIMKQQKTWKDPPTEVNSPSVTQKLQP